MSAETIDAGHLFHLNGTAVIALAEALLWLPGTKTLVASDLHFEKGSAYASKGSLLPPYDTHETVRRLMVKAQELSPNRIIALGDSFHDLNAEDRLDPRTKEQLLTWSKSTDFIWIEGNHDPEVPNWLHGKRCSHFEHAGLTFTHEPTGNIPGEVAGHLHPCAKVRGASGRVVRKRCFVSDGRTLIMPAFGSFTGGLNVKNVAFQGLFHSLPHVLVPGGTHAKPTHVRAISSSHLLAD